MRKIYVLKVVLACCICLAGFYKSGAQSNIVISQVYGGAGCGTAGCSTYQNDFIELFNRSNAPVNLSGWSVQYASASGTLWQVTNLTNVTLQPGQYYLVAESFNANGTSPLPAADVTGTITMSAIGGKVALVAATTALTVSCPTGGSLVDFVGYGSTANCSETAPAPTPSTTTSAKRVNNGCTDTQNNSLDFVAVTPAARNTGTTIYNCSTVYLSVNDVSMSEGNSGITSFTFTVSLSLPAPAGGVSFNIATANGTATTANNDYVQKSLSSQTIAQGASTYLFTVSVNGDLTTEPDETFFVNVSSITGATLNDGQGQGTIINDDVTVIPIHTIQGSGNTSPLVSQYLITQGIVTALKSNGFFMQAMDGNADADPNTSEGIFVFTGSAPPAGAGIGNDVQVSGTVVEFIPVGDPNSPSLTELTGPVISVQSTGNGLPAPVTISSTDLLVNNINNIEKWEGMRVQVSSLTVNGPTQGTIDEVNAIVTSTGYFYAVVTGTPKPFREPGVQQPDALPGGSPASVPRWDANPEILGIDTKAQTGSGSINVATGAVLTSTVGTLDYVRRHYTVDVDPTPPSVTNNSLSFTSVTAATTTEVSIASLNLQRFFDVTDDPTIPEPVLTSTAFNTRLDKASLTIRNVLNYPDVIGVEEAENLSTLQAIASKVNNDAVNASQPNPNYQAYLTEGNDAFGMDVGFIVKAAKINVSSTTQFGKTSTYINPANGMPETLYDRPPLVLIATFTKPGCATPIPFTVIVNHLISLAGIDDVTDGARVRAKRKAQAEYLANLIQARQMADATEKIISVGHYNAYEFNDGYVDVMGTIKGTPTPSNQVVAASADLVNPDLINLTDNYTASQRYTYNYSGSAMALDHVLVSANLSGQFSNFAVARLGADFPQILYGDNTRPERLTDHDVPVAYYNFTCPIPSLSTDYFRTKASGNWNNISTWESSTNNTSWHAATLAPDFNANTISILNGHSVTITAGITVDQLVINPGSTIMVSTGVVFVVK